MLLFYLCCLFLLSPCVVLSELHQISPAPQPDNATAPQPTNSTTPQADNATIPSPQPVNFTAPQPSVPSPSSTPQTLCGQGVIYESVIDDDVIVTIAVNDQISFLLTASSSVYRTVDGGRTWINQAQLYPVSDMQQSSNPLIVYFVNSESASILVTFDGGISYKTYTSSYYPLAVLPHPTLENVLASVQLIAATQPIPTYPYEYILAWSVDYGANWTNPIGPLCQSDTGYAAWGQGSDFIALFYDYDTIFYQALWTTNDMFAQNQTQPLGSIHVTEMLYASSISSYLIFTDDAKFFVAHSDLSVYTQAVFPESASTNTFLAGVSLESIFLGLQTTGAEIDLLRSELPDGVFTLSLPNITYSNSLDFISTNLNGVIIANSLVDVPNIGFTSRTQITFNDGLQWSQIGAPKDELASCQNCSLMFFGAGALTAEYSLAPVKGSLGILLASGMVGTTFGNSSLANLYISRDAGSSWNKILNGPWQFDSTANFIAATKIQTVTNLITYTQDQGLTWNECSFLPSNSTKNYTVLHILTDLTPSPNSLWLITKWLDTTVNTTSTGFSIFYIDFNTTMRTCNDSDYEYFTPPMYANNSCVLGQTISIKQKKQSSVCYVDIPLNNLTITQNCNCTINDYDCSYCFVPDMTQPGTPCVRSTDSSCTVLWDPTPAPTLCPVGTNYSGNPPYRRKYSTQCVNDLASLLVPRSVPCPPTPPPPPPAPASVHTPAPGPTTAPGSTTAPGPTTAPGTASGPTTASGPMPSPNMVVPVSQPTVSGGLSRLDNMACIVLGVVFGMFIF